MASQISDYVASEAAIAVSGTKFVAVRQGTRAVIADHHKGYHLGKHISGKLPYHYRTVEGIIADFASGNSALEAVLDLAANAPTTEKFRNSHCGEILAAEFVESHLGYRRLYSKLTLTTSQNTNVHKMDGLFVNLTKDPIEFLFVEAKSSVLPTKKTATKKHKSGILTQMIESLDSYSIDDPRFEFVRIRDNLAKNFSADDQLKIRSELTPPGPGTLKFLGMSVTNAATVNADDDDFILSTPCVAPFAYYALVVTNLSELASHAYGIWDAVAKAST